LQFSDRQLQISRQQVTRLFSFNSHIACVEKLSEIYSFSTLCLHPQQENCTSDNTTLLSLVHPGFLNLWVKIPFLLMIFLRKFPDKMKIFRQATI